jgi:hypothetical protein
MNEFSKNAAYALVIAEPPKIGWAHEPERKWKEFLHNLRQRGPQPKETQTIHENVWLIPLQTELPYLMNLFDHAKDYSIRLRILFLDDAPDWIMYPSEESSPKIS